MSRHLSTNITAYPQNFTPQLSIQKTTGHDYRGQLSTLLSAGVEPASRA